MYHGQRAPQSPHSECPLLSSVPNKGDGNAKYDPPAAHSLTFSPNDHNEIIPVEAFYIYVPAIGFSVG